MHGGIYYELPQFLMGHAGNCKYLYRFKLESSPNGPSYDGIAENVEHVFVHFLKSVEERRSLET